MKALIVSYCPRGERSRTKQLVDYAAGVLKSKKASVEVLDLAKEVPDFLLPDRLASYYRRNYMGEKLAGKDLAQLKKMDQMTDQLMKADIVVIGYPMYNFSQPAVVKGWFDSVMQKGKTWDFAQGGYAGLMKGRKALVLSTSGGAYEGDLASMDHSISLSKLHLSFMGYTVEAVTGAGINRYPEREQDILGAAKAQIMEIMARFV
ncbi:MAG: NAD(P)H-dependent oxidoreductase [Candidatus Omnitrophica bacterium]|nr:NAD(P)H-dependent oxidoreductase [Candidatus Omnitrophota bacterium]